MVAALQAANRTNVLLKAVKTIVYEDDEAIGFSVEQLFKEYSQLAMQFDRSINALRTAGEEFFRDLATGSSIDQGKERTTND
jgi:hypothetical protein